MLRMFAAGLCASSGWFLQVAAAKRNKIKGIAKKRRPLFHPARSLGPEKKKSRFSSSATRAPVKDWRQPAARADCLGDCRDFSPKWGIA